MCFRNVLNHQSILRPAWKSIAVFGLTLLTAGCGLSLGDKTPAPQAIVVSKPDSYNCISDIGNHISRYFGDHLSKEEIKTVMNCLKRSVVQFERYTHGRNGDSYTPEEFRRFIERYFVKDRKIPDQLVTDLMTLKMALVGGDMKMVTRPELLRLSDFIQFLGEILEDLKPHLSIFNMKKLPKDGIFTRLDEVRRATEALNRNAVLLGEWLEKTERSYSLDAFESLVHEVRKFSDWGVMHKKTRSAHKWISLLRSFKSAMVRPPANVVLSRDWHPVVTGMAQWFTIWVNYKYHIKPGPILYGQGFKVFVASIESGISLLRDSLRLQPKRTITYDQIFSMVSAAGALKLWPDVIRESSIRSMTKMVLDKMLGDSSINPKYRVTPGITPLILTRAEEEFIGWVAVQKHLDEGYSEVLRKQPYQNELYGGDPDRSLIRENLAGVMKPFPKHGIHFIEMQHILRFTEPLYEPGEPAATIIYPTQRKERGLAHGIHSLSRTNVMRILVRMLFRGYSTQKNFMEGVTEDELQDFYIDARDMGIDFEIFDPRSEKVGQRAFMEGNLFTSHSDGLNITISEILEVPLEFKSLPEDNPFKKKMRRKRTTPLLKRQRLKEARLRRKRLKAEGQLPKAEMVEEKALETTGGIADIYKKPNAKLLSFKETLSLITLMYSGGVIQNRMYDYFGKECGWAQDLFGKEVLDYFGRPKLEKECVIQHFSEGMPHFFVGMPNMIKYLNRRTANARRELIEIFIDTAKRDDEPLRYLERSEFAVLAMIGQYSESLMVRFDTNENQIISNAEIWKYVFPVFRGFIHKMALQKFNRDLTDEGDIRSTFAFIIRNGRLPEGKWWQGDLAGIWWQSLIHFDDSTDWDLSMDRGDIIKVFAAVLKASKTGKNGEIEEATKDKKKALTRGTRETFSSDQFDSGMPISP